MDGYNSHVVVLPAGFRALRIIQLIFGILVLALSAYLISRTFGLVHGQEVFALVTALITIIIVVYNLVAESSPNLYNMWAVLALDILATIFWLIAMAVLASLRAAYTVVDTVVCDEFGCYKKKMKRDDVANSPYLDSLTSDAVLSAIAFVLFVISLVLFSVALHRHNRGATTTETANKMEMGAPQAQAQTVAPAPGYQTATQQPIQPVYQGMAPAPAYAGHEQPQVYAGTPVYEPKA